MRLRRDGCLTCLCRPVTVPGSEHPAPQTALSGDLRVRARQHRGRRTPEGPLWAGSAGGQAALKDFTLSERRIRLDEMELEACTCASAATRPGASTGWAGLGRDGREPRKPFARNAVRGGRRGPHPQELRFHMGRRQPCGYAADRDHRRGRTQRNTRPAPARARPCASPSASARKECSRWTAKARSPPEPQRLPVGGRPAAHRAPPPAWGNAPQRHSGAHCDQGRRRFGSDGKTPQTPAAPASATSLAVTGAEASVSALSFGRGNSLSAADRKAGKDAGSPAVRDTGAHLQWPAF